MENSLEQLSASKLRALLIEEVKFFVNALESGNTQELVEMRTRLILIHKLLNEKEKAESLPIMWGKNTPKTNAEPSSQADLLPE